MFFIDSFLPRVHLTHNRFDTVKVRLQTSKDGHFRGPVDCVLQTVRKEGVAGFYKGATPPLVGWMVMDSVYVHSHFFLSSLGRVDD